MGRFEKIKNQKHSEFVREVGIQLETFSKLTDNLKFYIKNKQEDNALHKRGKKSSFSLEDMLLLTLYYLRHYPTFAQLGRIFNISESYAWKIYNNIVDILMKTLDLSDPKELLNSSSLEAIIIDVTEQPIERPKKGQKAYYSGKKNGIQLKSK